MHDLDRTQLEFEQDEDGGGFDAMDADDEAERVAELLAVTDEDELDQFIGGLVKRAARAAGRALRSDVGRAVTGTIKGAVIGAGRKALPQLGRALGRRIGGGSLGATIGERLARTVLDRAGAGELYGAEPDDEVQYEVAKQLVRFANDTTRAAVRNQDGASPQRVAFAAAAAAARKAGQSSDLRRSASASAAGPRSGGPETGRWVRRGRTITLTHV